MCADSTVISLLFHSLHHSLLSFRATSVLTSLPQELQDRVEKLKKRQKIKAPKSHRKVTRSQVQKKLIEAELRRQQQTVSQSSILTLINMSKSKTRPAADIEVPLFSKLKFSSSPSNKSLLSTVRHHNEAV